MSDTNRPKGMSQLDYLWLNFGGYTIGTEASASPKENAVLTELAVRELINKSTGGGIISLEYRNHPTEPDLVQLIGTNVEGKQLSIINMPKEVHVESFVKRSVTQVDVDNGCDFSINTEVLSIKLTNGKEYLVSLDGIKARGAETDTITTDVTNGIVNSHVKIDRNNNELSVVELKKSSQGLYSYLRLDNENTGVQLVKTNFGLKARIPLGERDIKFKQLTYDDYCLVDPKDSTTVYFISDKPYLYLGTQRYGVDIQAGMSIVSSLKYNSESMTLTYTTTDADQPVDIPLGPATEFEGGMMSKEQYVELKRLGQALKGIDSVETYIKEQTANLGATIKKSRSTDGKTIIIQLVSPNDEILSTTELDSENFLTSVSQRKASKSDVDAAKEIGLDISIGQDIIVYNMKNGDKYYLDLSAIAVNYAFSNSNSILFNNNDNNISANLNLQDNKIVYVDEFGVSAGISLVRDDNYVYIYGKNKNAENLIGKFKSPRRNLDTAHFFPNITTDIISEFPASYLDWKEYDENLDPVVPGEDYYVLVYEDLVTEEKKNYYISISSIASGIKISTRAGNLIRYDEEGALYASLNWAEPSEEE